MKITAETVAALPVPTDAPQAYHWDDDQAGFGVVVGKSGVRSFVFSGRIKGTRGSDGKAVKRRVTIGVMGAPRADGHAWTVRLARDEAKDLAARMARGEDPNGTRRKPAAPDSVAPASGPTLREGRNAHLDRMRKKKRAEASIRTFEYETEKYLAAWLDRPIAELTGAKLVEIHEHIKKNARAKANSNPANDRGAPLANRVVTHVSACFNTLNKKLEGKLGSWNPAKAVDKDVLAPKRERIDDLANYVARVATMDSAIRRDGLMLALYTGLRSEDVRTIRWEHVDLDEATLHLPDPKGGEGAAFTIPISRVPLEILTRRKQDNVRDLGAEDSGWAFPAIANDGDVGAITDLRQQVKADAATDTKHGRFPVEDVHTLRRTWESIAHEEGVSELDQHVLSNHSFGGHNVNATYIAQHIDHLAACADKIDAGITKRIKTTTKPAKRGRKLRSVA